MAKEIKIPRIAEGVDTATVAEVLVSEGDKVKKDQALITVESDKASVEIPSSDSGTVKEIKVSEGDEVSVGDVIVVLEADSGDASDNDSNDELDEKDTSEEKSGSDERDGDEDADTGRKKKESEGKDPGQQKDEDAEKDEKPKGEDSEDTDGEDETGEADPGEKEQEKKGNGSKGERGEDQDTASKESADGEDSGEDAEDDSEDADKEKDEEEEDTSGSDDEDAGDEDDEDDAKTDSDKQGGSAKPKESTAEEDTSDEEKKSGKADPSSDADPDKSGHKSGGKPEDPAGGPAASPGVRRLARELGVAMDKVAASTDSGRITEADVKAFVKEGGGRKDERTVPKLPDFGQWGEVEKRSLSGIRETTAHHVSDSWRTIPHVFQFDEAEISGIEKYIDEHTSKAEEKGGKLTITAVLVKVAAAALRQFPKFNASIDMESEEMILKKYIHIGIAVDTDKGLLVPVVKNADQKSIIDISVELSELSEKARSGKLSHDEMQGGTFTISNLGGIGGTNFTPIVYHPQVAILGVSRAAKKPFFTGDTFEPRDILPLSLSYDHRMIDGAEGVRFLDWIARALEDPYSALLGA